MIAGVQRFRQAIARIDAANGHDPNQVVADGQSLAKELLYSQRMTQWLDKMYPNAGEALQIAVRAQHLRRWMIPRSSYPPGRDGYRRWRTDLGSFHAEQTSEILREVGFDPVTISRIGALIRKEHLKSDPEAQALEDVACLVFLQYEFPDFLHKHPQDKLVTILKRSWAKMSGRGHAAALELAATLPGDAQALIHKALS